MRRSSAASRVIDMSGASAISSVEVSAPPRNGTATVGQGYACLVLFAARLHWRGRL